MSRHCGIRRPRRPGRAAFAPACATQPYRCMSAPSRGRSGPLTARALLLRDDWSVLRAVRDPGFLSGGRRGPAAGKSRLPRRRSRRLAPKRAVYGNHRCAARVYGVDDLGVVDALEVDRGDAKVGVAELALDYDERHALVRHLDGVRVAELVG